MSTIINARSPYFIKFDEESNVRFANISIFIYSGVFTTAKPSTPTYTLTKYTRTASTQFVVFDISSLIRDYLETEYFTNAVDAVWVEVDAILKDETGSQLGDVISSDYLAIDGYGDFDEGANPRQSILPSVASFTPMVLQSNTCIPFVRGRDIKIPVFSETNPTATTDSTSGMWEFVDEFWNVEDSNWNDTSTTQSITDSNNSADKIQYLNITTDNAQTGDTITISSTTGTAQSITLTLEEICLPKYENYRAIFYNKFGALQSFWFPNKSTTALKTKSSTYKANTFSETTMSYNQYKHNIKRFDVLGNDSIKLNTTLLNECLNEPIEQLLMAEQIWLEDEALKVLPVVVKTANQERKIGVNDKANIQYTLDFDYAFDRIQNVR